MSGYKLNYFNARGLAEVSRWVFAVAGQEYEDRRFSGEEWPTIKLESPTGKSPWLEVDGVKIVQSLTIARFLARKFGLAGGDDLEQARVDMIADCAKDLFQILLDNIFHRKKGEETDKYQEALSEKLPASLLTFEKFLVDNGGGDGYFVGDQITWCDMLLVTFLCYFEQAEIAHLLDAVPKVKAHRTRVEGHPKIAEWIAKRPKTER